jgi:hypothetical protein
MPTTYCIYYGDTRLFPSTQLRRRMPTSLDALIARAAEKPVALTRLARALAAIRAEAASAAELLVFDPVRDG